MGDAAWKAREARKTVLRKAIVAAYELIDRFRKELDELDAKEGK